MRNSETPRFGVRRREGCGSVPRELVIAVVDDDDSFRLALAESLCSLGYGAKEFASAEEFIAGDDEEACDCVITDVRMPGMSGLELGRLIASRQSPVPVIMVTAVRERGLERAAAKGSFCLLKKPVGTDALVECLQQALEG
jgi:FixJ family two-component response regulator